MSLSDEQAAFLEDFCKMVLFATYGPDVKPLLDAISMTPKKGFKITGGELQRMIEQQRHYLKTGRSKTLASMHLDKLAGDLNFFKVIPPRTKEVYINALPREQALEILKPVGVYWESLTPKNKWGGFWESFKDLPHFERRV